MSKYFWIFLFVFAFAHNPGNIISSEFMDFMEIAEVQNELEYWLGEFAPTAEYDVSIYKIIYETTDPFGDSTIASGVIAFPHAASLAFPVASFQHGTVVERDEVASVYGFDIPTLWASATGYVTVEADYLGLGESQIFHPYHIEIPTANAVVDLLRAGQTFCNESDEIQHNNQLFLIGYSEGGYATMATHKAIEEQNEFEITASFPMAGAYDLSGVMTDLMLSDEPYAAPYYFPYVVLSAIEYYELGELSDFFTDYYAELLPTLFDGEHAGWEINPYLPSVPKNMLRPEVLEEFENDPNHPIRQVSQDNDLWDWSPQAPMYIYHAMADEIVPVENSIVTYNHFIENGAENVVLELLPEYYGGHSEAGLYCIYGGFVTIKSLSHLRGKGDPTDDGEINVLDIILTVSIILEQHFPDNFEFWAADCNANNAINVADIIAIISIILE
ncbi:hypothetical protein H8D59_01610 [bacterium]|nr:hypothetical protein [bacterium]